LFIFEFIATYHGILIVWYLIGYMITSAFNAHTIAESLQYDPTEDWQQYLMACLGPVLILFTTGQGNIFAYGFAFPGRSADRAMIRAKEEYTEYTNILAKDRDRLLKYVGHGNWRHGLAKYKFKHSSWSQ